MRECVGGGGVEDGVGLPYQYYTILVGELELNPVKENNLDDQDLFSDPFSKKITLAERNLWNF